MKNLTRRSETLLLVCLLAVLIVPWLGETLFNSKGEPREAIVAVSMLESGDWVLPTSYGGDIPYKPPFLAWIIAVCSLIFNGGVVNEFCSRLPSALALIGMTAGFFYWLRPRAGRTVATVSALVLATSFEVFRSGVICRVDMVLTACIVLGLLTMHSWREGRQWWKLPLIVLFLSGAVLTKGPVGALLPCLAMGIYCLLKRDNFFITVGWLVAVCVASMALPAWWYVAAYNQGGQHFYDLAMEENIGRLTGTMGYGSHVNPWYYNLLTLIWGMLPWTLLALLGACVLKWRKPRFSDLGLFSTTVALTVLIFYCIPESKRSVYLLPMYPFLAYGVANLLMDMRQSRSLKVYARVWLWVVLVASVVAPFVPFFPLDKLTVLPLRPWQWLLVPVAPAVCIYLLKKKAEPVKVLLASTMALFFLYLSVLQPLVLNPKSDKYAVEDVRPLLDAKVPVYSLIQDSLLRYYTLNFYLDDRLQRIEDADTARLTPPYAVLVQGDYMHRLPDYVSAPYDSVTIKKRSCDTGRAIILCTTKK